MGASSMAIVIFTRGWLFKFGSFDHDSMVIMSREIVTIKSISFNVLNFIWW